MGATVLGEHLLEGLGAHGQPVTELIGGEDTAEEVTEEVTKGGETRLEDIHVGDDLRVKEDVEDVVRHLDGVDVNGAEGCKDFHATPVLFAWYPFEVIVAVVGYVTVLVVSLAEMSFGIEWSGSLESKEDDDMAILVAKFSHLGIEISTLAVMAMHPMNSVRRGKDVKDLTESAVSEGEEMTHTIRVEISFTPAFFGDDAFGEGELLTFVRTGMDDTGVIKIVCEPHDADFGAFRTHKHRTIEKDAGSTLRGVAVFSKGGAKLQEIMSPSRDILSPKCPLCL